MFSFGEKGEVIAVFDIGSASVGGMLFRKKENGKPEILIAERVDIKVGEEIEKHLFNRHLEEAFRKLLVLIRKNSPALPDTSLCVLSSLFYVSQTKIIRVRRGESFKVEKNFIDKLLADEMEIFRSMHKRDFMPQDKGEAVFFGKEIMKVLLNGYEIAKPIDKKTKELDVYAHLSLGSQEVKERIEKAINEELSVGPVVFRTFPFIAYSALKETLNAERGFLFVDIAGEITDISFVRENVLEESVSFPLGKNYILRRISGVLNTFIKESSSIFERVAAGRESGKISPKVSSVMKEVKDKWCALFKESLEKAGKRKDLPQTVFLVGNEKVVDEFSECVRSDFFSDFTVLGKPFSVEKLSIRPLEQYFDFKEGFLRADVFLMLEALFADKNL
jgi:cell division ATPase FtsA